MVAAVSELLSDVLGAHFPDFPLEDDVHVTLAGVEPAAFRIVVAFAYGGIADIPRNSVRPKWDLFYVLADYRHSNLRGFFGRGAQIRPIPRFFCPFLINIVKSNLSESGLNLVEHYPGTLWRACARSRSS